MIELEPLAGNRQLTIGICVVPARQRRKSFDIVRPSVVSAVDFELRESDRVWKRVSGSDPR